MAALHIGAETANLEIHRLAVFGIVPQRLVGLRGLAEQLLGLFERDLVRRQVLAERGAVLALFQKRSIAARREPRSALGPAGVPERNAANVASVDLGDFVVQLLLQARLAVAEIKAVAGNRRAPLRRG